MKIEVTDITVDNKSRDLTVHFTTPFGSGVGIWIGDSPKVAHQYEVELDIEEVLIWNDTIKETGDKNVVIDYDEQGIILQGKIERVDSDGVVFVRLHSSLIMLETSGGKPLLPETFISIRPKRIMLFPHDMYEAGHLEIHHDQIDSASNGLFISKPGDKVASDLSIMQPEDLFDNVTYKELIGRTKQLKEELNYLHSQILLHPKEARPQIPEWAKFDVVSKQLRLLTREHLLRLPIYTLAQCPYCQLNILQPFDHFSLLGLCQDFKMTKVYEGGREWHFNIPPRQHCKHALFTTFFINLNNLLPDDLPAWSQELGLPGQGSVPLNSSPYIIVWPLIAQHTSAVIHTLPIGRLDDPEPVHRYSAYFITYFANDSSNIAKMWVSGGMESGYIIPATSNVQIDFDLEKWIHAERLFWINPKNKEQLLQEPVTSFPYENIQPQGWYRITKNIALDGPHPYSNGFIWQGKVPHHDESFPETIE